MFPLSQLWVTKFFRLFFGRVQEFLQSGLRRPRETEDFGRPVTVKRVGAHWCC